MSSKENANEKSKYAKDGKIENSWHRLKNSCLELGVAPEVDSPNERFCQNQDYGNRVSEYAHSG
jgi:hypothetical protein